MIRFIVIAGIAAALTASSALVAPVIAQPQQRGGAPNVSSMNLATSLGNIIASEDFCGLQYNQEAIAEFINKNVRADDMQFLSLLRLMTDGTRIQNQDMSPSGKTAHCAQTVRVARSNGFIR